MSQPIHLCDLGDTRNGKPIYGTFMIGQYFKDLISELETSKVMGFISKDLDRINKGREKPIYPGYRFISDSSKINEVQIHYILEDGRCLGGVKVTLQNGHVEMEILVREPIQPNLL